MCQVVLGSKKNLGPICITQPYVSWGPGQLSPFGRLSWFPEVTQCVYSYNNSIIYSLPAINYYNDLQVLYTPITESQTTPAQYIIATVVL